MVTVLVLAPGLCAELLCGSVSEHLFPTVLLQQDVPALVFGQFPSPYERLPADAAAVRLFPGVDAPVRLQAAGLGEPSPAHVAAVHLPVQMRHGVRLEVIGVAELLAAGLAGVGPRTRVDVHVVLQVDGALEGFPADVADRPLPRFLSRVDPHVVLERAGVAAAFAAGLADVRPLARVLQHVVLEGAAVAAAFAADVAGEQLLPAVLAQVVLQDAHVAAAQAQHVAARLPLRVRHAVDGQRRRGEETLAARFADEILLPRMLVFVFGQTLPALEGLRADGADQRRSQRRAPVSLQRRHPRELALAQRTPEAAWFVDEMPAHVSLERELVGEVDGAVRTPVRPLAGVTSGVRVQASERGKALSAVGAEVGFGVAQVVSLQQTLQAEGFRTRRTLQGLRRTPPGLGFPGGHAVVVSVWRNRPEV